MINYPHDLCYHLTAYYLDKITDSVFSINYLLDWQAFLAVEECAAEALLQFFEKM